MSGLTLSHPVGCLWPGESPTAMARVWPCAWTKLLILQINEWDHWPTSCLRSQLSSFVIRKVAIFLAVCQSLLFKYTRTDMINVLVASKNGVQTWSHPTWLNPECWFWNLFIIFAQKDISDIWQMYKTKFQPQFCLYTCGFNVILIVL